MNTFERDGVSFKYPTNWRAEAEEVEAGGWAVTVSSPDTAFALVSVRPDAHDPAELADQALDALREEYKELDAENRLETIAGMLAIGHDIDFITLDAAITCRTRSLATLTGPLLVMTQVSEYDQSRNDPVLRAIVASLRVEE
ncbi:MAG: hypothetical protein C0467_10235 [Planctomycetaceae bacterium]|nr:hypothetical protein [Planctomycetaceae bacterium]